MYFTKKCLSLQYLSFNICIPISLCKIQNKNLKGLVKFSIFVNALSILFIHVQETITFRDFKLLQKCRKALCAATSISYLIERCVLLCLLNSLVVCPHAKIYMCGKSIRMFLMHTNTRSLILFPKVVCLSFLILIHADKRRF